MDTLADRLELKKLREKIVPLPRPYKVRRVAIFGSVTRGEDAPGSDLDILVKLPLPGERPVIGLKWFDLIEELSTALERSVDLVTEDGLSPYIRPYVEEDFDINLGIIWDIVQADIPPLKVEVSQLLK